MYTEQNASAWYKGSIGTYNYTVVSSTELAFTASKGIEYNKSVGDDLSGGISLYVGNTESTIQEYIYDEKVGNWSEGSTFQDTDPASGASVWSTSATAYLFTTSYPDGVLHLWFRDYDDGSGWQKRPPGGGSLLRNGSICGFFDAWWQEPNGIIQGSNFTNVVGNGSEAQWNTTYDVTPQAAIPHSAISCWHFFPSTNVQRNIEYQIFYQSESNGIEEAVMLYPTDNETVSGAWNISSLRLSS